MFKNPFLWGLTAFQIVHISCNSKQEDKKMEQTNTGVSILMNEWTGKHNGVPPFNQVKIQDIVPAEEAAITLNRNEIKKITSNSEPPSFKNTLEALERCGHERKRVEAIYYVWQSSMNTKEFGPVEEYMEPRIAGFYDSIMQNAELFKRIETVYNSEEKSKLNPEQQRLLSKYYTNMVLAGAQLNESEKSRVTEINQKLAALFTKFNQHQLADENDKFIEVTNQSDLAGLAPDFISSLSGNAEKKGKKGTWLITNTRSCIEPFLTTSQNRALREKAWRMFIKRGDNGDANDNNSLIPEILQLRAERAQLLGYPTHAHWRLADKMAKTPDNALSLLHQVWEPAVERVHEEVKDMQQMADKEGVKIKIEPWDYRYYAEKVRKAKYDIDENEVKQYLQLENICKALFFTADQVFGLSFEQITDVPVFHEDVSVYKVIQKANGQQIGLWYFDPYAREGKRSGAWMTAYREQEKLSGPVTTIVSNNCNFIKGAPGEPVLISWDDASTMFHEFGHALHGLNSNVTYPLLSGTNTATDYVEFPSQIMERWLSTPEVLNKFALHYKTGNPIPKELITKIQNASKFNSGFSTVETLASALVDMYLHLEGDKKINPKIYEKEMLAKLKMPHEIVMRHRLPAFGHIFSSDAYSAGYYSYCWSDVLSADAYSAFTEAKGPYDKEIAKKLYDNIFSVGGTIDEAEAYRRFRGRAPKVDALMEDKGFETLKKK